MSTLIELRKRLDTAIQERDSTKAQIRRAVRALSKAVETEKDALDARALIQLAAEQTQQTMEGQMSSLVTSAFQGIFPDPYEFIVRFVQRRNKTECDLIFSKGGEEFRPLDTSGGGALDVASFALRVAFWTIRRNRNVIILDEPFRFLSPNLQPLAGQLIKKLSETLGLQFIIVTNLLPLVSFGDRVFWVENGVVEDLRTAKSKQAQIIQREWGARTDDGKQVQ